MHASDGSDIHSPVPLPLLTYRAHSYLHAPYTGRENKSAVAITYLVVFVNPEFQHTAAIKTLRLKQALTSSLYIYILTVSCGCAYLLSRQLLSVSNNRLISLE